MAAFPEKGREEMVAVNGFGPNADEAVFVEVIKEALAIERATRPLPNYEFSDMTILRFYRGRKGDVKKAVTGLYKNLEWRAEHKPSEITDDMIQAEVKDKKIFVSGVDKTMRPCIYVGTSNLFSYVLFC